VQRLSPVRAELRPDGGAIDDLMGSTAPVVVPPATPLQQQAFDRLKEALTTPPIVALPWRGRQYVPDVDACGTQLGAALLQEQDYGKLQPVAYISLRLATNEPPYGVTEKECLAVVWASRKLCPDLKGDRFLLRKDHDCFRWILNIEGLGNPRFARWCLRLSELEFDVAYKPGITQNMANSIPRLESGGSEETAFDDAVPVFAVRANTVRNLDAANYVGGPTVRDIYHDAVLSAQAKNGYFQEVVKALNAGRRIPFFEDPDEILRRRAAPDGAHQVVVPTCLQEKVLHVEHDATFAGHPGESRMYAAMRRYSYWVGIRGCHGYILAVATSTWTKVEVVLPRQRPILNSSAFQRRKVPNFLLVESCSVTAICTGVHSCHQDRTTSCAA